MDRFYGNRIKPLTIQNPYNIYAPYYGAERLIIYVIFLNSVYLQNCRLNIVFLFRNIRRNIHSYLFYFISILLTYLQTKYFFNQ